MVDKDEERMHISNVLLANGYPHSLINSRLPSRLHQTDESTDRTQPKATVVIPYIKHVSEGIRRILSKVDIRTCFKPNQTLRQLLVHPKDKIPLSDKTTKWIVVHAGAHTWDKLEGHSSTECDERASKGT